MLGPCQQERVRGFWLAGCHSLLLSPRGLINNISPLGESSNEEGSDFGVERWMRVGSGEEKEKVERIIRVDRWADRVE